jgi:ribonuclease HI
MWGTEWGAVEKYYKSGKKKKKDSTEEAIKSKCKELSFLQDVDGTPNLEAIKNTKAAVHQLLEQEEMRWKQRAKIDWLQHGDKNTKYFHACANQRQKSNLIRKICDARGTVWEDPDDIGRAFVEYFTSLFKSERLEHVGNCLEHVERKVTAEMNAELVQPFTEVEVCSAVHQMAPMKAPGPDGFDAHFFQKNWAIVGVEVCKAVLFSLNSGVINKEINSTYIALIPKTKNPTNVTDFRPISLCNVLYKIISKVLANRLKKILPHVISPYQSAFIPGRLITDNILAAYETLHTMHSKMYGKSGFMAVKVDMSKAYDRVEWNFLEAVMEKLGFERRWINLMMMCVRTAHFSILINGVPTGKITPTRGIRQGDPISPYLFLLCAEALSSMLSHADRQGTLRGAPTSKKGPRLNHLFFADDSLLFCRADICHWNRLSHILKIYEKASGQKLNTSKTAIFFSRNTTKEDQSTILQAAAIPASQRYDTYLGLPALVGKSRTKEFKSIVDRIEKRLQDWKLKFLSQAGKEILLKAVIQAIPTYSMSIFQMPRALCTRINSLMQKFWWSHNRKATGVPWMSWSRMGVTKAKGGMGFRDFHCFNKALLAKQLWRLWHNPNSLIAGIMRAKYYPTGQVLEANLGSKPSFAWRSIYSSKDLLMKGLVWRIGNGEKVRIWGDKWGPIQRSYMAHPSFDRIPTDAKVSMLIDKDTGWWDQNVIDDLFNEDEAKTIKAIPLSCTNQEDRLIWRGTTNGLFSVRSGYHLEKEDIEHTKAGSSNGVGNSNIWKSIWNLKVPNMEKHFIWRACHDILPTRENLMRRKIVSDPFCPICGLEIETVGHILWECSSAMDVWGVCKAFQKRSITGQSFISLVEEISRTGSENDMRLFVGLARQIWLRRNSFVHEGTFTHPDMLVRKAHSCLEEFEATCSKEGQPKELDGTGVNEKWQAPPEGIYKANWDAALNHQSGRIGIGTVIRDHEGKVKAAQCSVRKGNFEPSVAEALAAVQTLTLCKDLGLTKINLEGDAKNVVTALNLKEANWSKGGHIIADAQVLLQNFLFCEINYVSRVRNNAAHNLAKLAARLGFERQWREECPDCISEIIRVEQIALSH